ncbi:membrane-spanning 4-domains subfamily A member 8-like isoform X2 [Sphaerodactylus townsendi]|uniref:membrane-spanning 4-domains subfamily A member 8-like isoform X2 n=1 Tax=Sphaerodactylus townsendi TaxID=933632 RepID=UPI0020269AB0|nr:membrane-spanning 4-domains subfamily A member 8-like isoform X2 [Sphaerodactylus townsendi]
MDARDPETVKSFSSSKGAPSEPLKQFYKGELLALGYIISGSLSVAAARNPRISLVKGMLGMNIVSAVAAGIGLVGSSLFMNFQSRPRRSDSWCASNINDTKLIQVCQENSIVPYATVYNVIAMLLALTILEFGITIVSAAFGCATVCRNNYSETVSSFKTGNTSVTPHLPQLHHCTASSSWENCRNNKRYTNLRTPRICSTNHFAHFKCRFGSSPLRSSV